MKILIDECVDERLRNSFSIHDCQTARFAGFAGLENGDLLDSAESRQYNVLIAIRSRLRRASQRQERDDNYLSDSGSERFLGLFLSR
jgi:hypothetical protein